MNFLPEVSFIRVQHEDGQREICTMMRNRAHSNVAFMLGEDWRYQPEKDTLTIYPGILASYPNFAFNVVATDIGNFATVLAQEATACVRKTSVAAAISKTVAAAGFPVAKGGWDWGPS